MAFLSLFFCLLLYSVIMLILLLKIGLYTPQSPSAALLEWNSYVQLRYAIEATC